MDQCSVLAQAIKRIFWYKQLEPSNLAEERAAFLAGKRHPQFRYAPPSYDPAMLERELRSMDIPDGPLAPILLKSKSQALLLNDLVLCRGDAQRSRSISVELWGVPDQELITQAEEIIAQPVVDEVFSAEPSDVEQAFEEALAEYGLTDWRIERTERSSAGAYPERDPPTLCVPANRRFAAADPVRLAAHEVAVHALRHSNGAQQPCELLTIGTAGFLETEEGLALYAERTLGALSRTQMRVYAARVLAAAWMLDGVEFRSVFEALRNRGLSEIAAFETTYRAFRGGGNTKDIVYLRGLRSIESYVRDGGDLSVLFCGKISLEDVPLATELIEKGIWSEPKRIPGFLKTGHAEHRSPDQSELIGTRNA